MWWFSVATYGCKAFPSPYGVSFILMVTLDFFNHLTVWLSFRLLTEYHSFLYIRTGECIVDLIGVSVSLRSIIHSYYIIENQWKAWIQKLFPSPYGVSFILIRLIIFLKCLVLQFPSPYGVSFILIKLQGRIISVADKGVSVSLRSIIHSYLQKS